MGFLDALMGNASEVDLGKLAAELSPKIGRAHV